jgi:long-chain acyl-CoA synthetase
MTWIEILNRNSDRKFLSENNVSYTYCDLAKAVEDYRQHFLNYYNTPVFVLEAKNTFSVYAKFIALLIEKKSVILLPPSQFRDLKYREYLKAEIQSEPLFLSIDDESAQPCPQDHLKVHPLIAQSIFESKPTFIIKTSGSSGQRHKFILHDSSLFLKKYLKIESRFQKTLTFIPLESIAGVETLFEALVSGAELVSTGDSFNPKVITDLLINFQIDYFLTTPSFLNMWLLSGHLQNTDLSHLSNLAYGSEPSVPTVLQKLKKILPKTKLINVYGMSEIGLLVSTTPQEKPHWFFLEKSFNDWRIVDGMLEAQSMTPMIGYLNRDLISNSWFKTRDFAKETDGFLQVFGRDSDVINVAGRKFFPAEVENKILEMHEVSDVSVFSEPNPLIGSAIVAKIYLKDKVDEQSFKITFKKFCELNLLAYQFPQRLIFSPTPLAGDRQKKIRRA